MAGAMRKMGVYLGLVEDDDARSGYDRYAARQTDYDDRGYDRYARADDYDDGGVEAGYGEGNCVDTGQPAGDHFGAGYDPEPIEEFAAEPEPLPRRVGGARALGLAGSSVSAAPSGAGATRLGSGSGGAGAAGLAKREPVAATPAPPTAAPPMSAQPMSAQPMSAQPMPAPPMSAQPMPAPYRITTLHPRTYNEARTIGERFREGLPVIMNLTEMDDADAKRLVDFAAGLSFGLRGSIERVTAKVFLISPQNVDVTAEDKARIREGGFFNQS